MPGEKALVGAFYVIVKTDGSFAALIIIIYFFKDILSRFMLRSAH